jgi:hypothetical protein
MAHYMDTNSANSDNPLLKLLTLSEAAAKVKRSYFALYEPQSLEICTS